MHPFGRLRPGYSAAPPRQVVFAVGGYAVSEAVGLDVGASDGDEVRSLHFTEYPIDLTFMSFP